MSHVVMLGLEVMNIDDSLILAVEDKQNDVDVYVFVYDMERLGG